MLKIIAFLFVLMSTLFIAYSQNNYTSKLDTLLNFYTNEGQFNGSVLVAKKGKILLSKGYGIQNAHTKQKNTPQTIFQIYSITKPFTSTVIFKLIEEKKLSLSDKLSTFYPDFPKGDSITVEHLLTHTSGLYDYTRGNNLSDQTEKSFITFLKTMPLDFSPGTAWNYSNSGYYLLGYIIEKVTGTSYESAVANYIFTPLQMSESGFAFKYLVNKNKATGYTLLNKKAAIPSVVYDPPGPYAAGGIYSTTLDLYKFYNGLKTNKLLTSQSKDKAYTAVKNNYGYGWMVFSQFDKKTIGHSGAGAGFRSNYVQIPEDDICIIVLDNSENDVNKIIGGILKVLYNKPYKIPHSGILKKDILKKYQGVYKASNGLVLYISVENGRLVAKTNGQPKSILFPEKTDLFYVEEINGYVSFRRNGMNKVTSLLFDNGQGKIVAERINAAWGIVGSATTVGWDGTDIQLTETLKKNVWRATDVKLGVGAFKFRLNSDWVINLGMAEKDKLIYDGDNISITREGIYDVLLDLSDPNIPKYKLIPKSK